MENSNNENELKRKKEIEQDFRNKTLFNFFKDTIGLIVACVFFAYLGYRYCLDNNDNIFNGIVFGSIFPTGIYFLREHYVENLFIYIL